LDRIALAFAGDRSFLEDPSIVEVKDCGNHLEVKLRDQADPQRILHLAAAGARISRFELMEPSLEEIFIRAVAKEKAEVFASLGISATRLIFFVLFYLLGFLFYSALSAAFGASAGSEQEIQQFSFLLALPMIACLVLMTYIFGNPDAPAVVALSLFPPCAPIVMYVRMAAQMPPMWQLALSVALMAAAVWAMLWIAARIYRVGILMYGKRATLPEILRWLRSS
jgi:ABC-type Na+ efflux pump permease subunit